MAQLPGRKIEIFRPRERVDGVLYPALEETFVVRQVKAFLPAGPTSDGGYRKDDLLQFWSVDHGKHAAGGLRTIRTRDIINF